MKTIKVAFNLVRILTELLLFAFIGFVAGVKTAQNDIFVNVNESIVRFDNANIDQTVNVLKCDFIAIKEEEYTLPKEVWMNTQFLGDKYCDIIVDMAINNTHATTKPTVTNEIFVPPQATNTVERSDWIPFNTT